MEWISVEDRLPEMTKEEFLKHLGFKCKYNADIISIDILYIIAISGREFYNNDIGQIKSLLIQRLDDLVTTFTNNAQIAKQRIINGESLISAIEDKENEKDN